MRRAIVIGASSGRVSALRSIAAGLPPDLPAPVLAVLHVGPQRSHMPAIISRSGPLPCRHPEHGETIRPGVIYIAPPNLHLLVEDGRAVLRRSPRENWARPAIDPLFRSAAREYGPRLIGVVLSGALNDGTAGLHAIKRCGGTTVVQDPADAVEPSMPQSALAHVAVDRVAPLAELPSLIARLAATVPPPAPVARPEQSPMNDRSDPWEVPAAVTCPSCGGAMRSDTDAGFLRYHCHIGHVFSAETLVEAQLVEIDRSLEAAFRSLEERALICEQLARQSGVGSQADAWRAAIEEAHARAAILERLLGSSWTRPEIAEP